uniref:uncharacterized protein LOC122599847 n=1 Tax=Erigeron canadensis TaxID=72917 RepID=UPI001CB995B8|nr:uncharacterized protein LOC122599847 [Erigeron canadensis]
MEALQDDNGDGGMLCTEHPYKNNTPAGGICAFCLQEKLGKLVSSSFPIAVFPSSSSSSPSFRSDINVPTTTSTAVSSTVAPPRMMMSSTSLIASNTRNNECNYHHYYSNSNSTNGSNKSRILYLLGQKKKKKKDVVNIIDDRSKNMMFKRSKSTVTPRRGGLHFTDSDENINSPHKQRGFWSFLYLQKHSKQQQKTLRHISSNSLCSSSVSSYPQAQRSRDMIVVEENGSPCQASFDRKVSRSRSVGCGSRSFSGDFFERISTGFGDCTLRRVESQREGKSKVSGIRGGGGGQDCIKERVSEGSDLKMTSAVTSGHSHHQQHSRSKSWGWALASPMRAFSKPSSKKEQQASNKNQTPNLAAIPSLLSVRS